METIERKLTDSGFVIRVGGEIAYTPLGKKLKTTIENKVRTQLNYLKAEEIELPTLVDYSKLQLDRNITFARNFSCFKTTTKEGYKLLLARTSEETATDYFMQRSREEAVVYQIKTKFRNENASELGFLKRQEFTMVDAYSFDHSVEEMERTYRKVKESFAHLLSDLQIPFSMRDTTADCSFGMSSEEFLCDSEGLQGVELGHIFQLGDLYTKPYGRKLMMGSYGLGIDRLVAAVALSNQGEGR
ncbi:MAG: hypothetical protein QGH47_00095 [Candidatus Woesearchaeota archaeon]|jgi:prolyl-tRNA synthetase|nr:hypothetical protein [Candidatus Woesearchaeota archaeon]